MNNSCPDLDNLNELQRENIRRFISSPFPLANVSKPKKILFEDENQKQANNVMVKACNMQASTVRLQATKSETKKMPDYCDKSEIQNKNTEEKKSLTRKDFILKELTNLTKSTKLLDRYKLDVSVEVNAKYYQKWARNKKASCKYTFPSLLQKLKTNEIRESSKGSGSCRSIRATENIPGLNATKHVNNTSSKNILRKTMNELDDQILGGYECSDNYNFEEYDEDHLVFVDSADAFDSDSDSISPYLNELDQMGPEMELLTEKPQQWHHYQNSDCFENEYMNNSNHVLTEMSAERLTDVNKYKNSKSVSEEIFTNELTNRKQYFDAKGRISADESSSSTDLKNRHTFREYVTLSTNEISTTLLDNVVDLQPHKRYQSNKKRKVVNIAYRRMIRNSNKGKNISKTVKCQELMSIGKISKGNKQKSVSNISDSVQNFRCKRLDKRLSVHDSVNQSSEVGINRVPVKMAETIPRYTGPENLIVDFEALRIAAHFKRLKTNTQSTKADVALKLWKDTETYEKMPYIDKSGFRTVISGCAVR